MFASLAVDFVGFFCDDRAAAGIAWHKRQSKRCGNNSSKCDFINRFDDPIARCTTRVEKLTNKNADVEARIKIER